MSFFIRDRTQVLVDMDNLPGSRPDHGNRRIDMLVAYYAGVAGLGEIPFRDDFNNLVFDIIADAQGFAEAWSKR
jgi:hypothetical protein